MKPTKEGGFNHMIRFDHIPKIYIITSFTDLRKGIDGYAHIVQDNFQLSPFQDALFIFCNRHRNKIKCLYWDKSGFWLWYKRLEEGHFKWIKTEPMQVIEIDQKQLRWLLDGLKIEQKTAFKELDYTCI